MDLELRAAKGVVELDATGDRILIKTVPECGELAVVLTPNQAADLAALLMELADAGGELNDHPSRKVG